MDEKKYETTLRDVKWLSIAIFLYFLMIYINQIASETLKGITIVFMCFHMVLTLGTITGCFCRKIYGPICGIVAGVLLAFIFISAGTIMGIIYSFLGIALVIECINLIRYMKK